MEQWVEQFKKIYAIQGATANTIISNSVRQMKCPVWMTDDDTVYNEIKNTITGWYTGQQAKTKWIAFDTAIHNRWPTYRKPSEIPRRVYYGNSTTAHDAEDQMLQRTPSVPYDWNQPCYSSAYLQSGVNRAFYIYSAHDGAYHSIGSVFGVDGYQIDGVFTSPIIGSNFTANPRAGWCDTVAHYNTVLGKIDKLFYVTFSYDFNTSVHVNDYVVCSTTERTQPNSDWEILELNASKGWITGGDPYGDIVDESEGDDGPSEGSGDFDPEDIPEPDPLTFSSVNTGFVRIYNPTAAELQDFSEYMWTDATILSTVINHVKQYFEDPMDAFIALHILPVEVPNETDPIEVKLLFMGTGKYMHAATNQFVTVDCGSVDLSEIYGSALDYSPNTKIDLFLPFIGTVGIDADEVMGRTVSIKYNVDICTGNCVAIIKVSGKDKDGNSITMPLYQFSGNCAIRIPFTAASMDGYVDAGLAAAKLAAGAISGAAVGAAAGAAASAPYMAETTASAAAVSKHQMNFAAPTTSGEVFQTQQATANQAAKYNHAATATRAVAAGLGIRAAAKPGFAHTSGFTGNAGYMSYKVPYFIMKVPRMVNPGEYGKYNGYPSLTYQLFSDLIGYTEVQQVQLTNINATANELDEIQSLLKSGVIM